MITRVFGWSMAALAIAGLAGCSAPKAGNADSKAFAPPTDLTARLLDPINIELRWKDNAKAEAGYFVEYSPNANDEYVVIEALPANSTRFHHAHLLPETRFVYRVRPYFGKPSNTASITTGKSGPQQGPTPEMLTNAPPGNAGPLVSLRSAATMDAAAPTDLTATLIPPAGVSLHWKNHAADADGCLLEIKPEWDSQFKPSAFLESNTTSLVTYNFPAESKFTFRVREFFYGKPSNLAEQTTGKDPSLGPGKFIQYDPSPKPRQ